MNNIKFLSIFMLTTIVITTAKPNNNEHNIRRLLQQKAPIATNDGPFTIEQGGETIITVTNNDYDSDGGNIRIDEIVDEPNEGTAIIIDNNNIKYIADSFNCDLTDTFTYTVTDYDDDEFVSNVATVLIIIECPPSTFPTPQPTQRPTTCDHPLNRCTPNNDNSWISWFNCDRGSLWEYSCPSHISCDDENGYDEDDFVRPCVEIYLFDDSADCC